MATRLTKQYAKSFKQQHGVDLSPDLLGGLVSVFSRNNGWIRNIVGVRQFLDDPFAEKPKKDKETGETKMVKPMHVTMTGGATNLIEFVKARREAGETDDHAIVEALTKAIVEHRLHPGTKLAEQKLADHFGVSRTLVRQALFQLSQNRLIRLEPARGAFVAAPSVDEAKQGFAVRRMLEADSVLSWRLPIQDIGHESEGCSYVPRLFRNTPGAFFIGRVHEQAFASLEKVRRSWGLESRLGEVVFQRHIEVLRACLSEHVEPLVTGLGHCLKRLGCRHMHDVQRHIARHLR